MIDAPDSLTIRCADRPDQDSVELALEPATAGIGSPELTLWGFNGQPTGFNETTYATLTVETAEQLRDKLTECVTYLRALDRGQ